MGEIRLANCSVLKCRNRLKDRLAYYEDAEEQGLLVRLPQKTVYSIGWGKGKNCDNLCPASIDGVGCCSLCDHGELIIYEEECNQAHLPHIGKTVFLTREEAEKALEWMNNG
jgi:hypothetical protein